MKFTTVLSFVALAASTMAQSFASSAVSSAVAPAVSLTPLQQCIAKCDNDTNCVATCVGVPHPNAAQANATTACSMNCDQGDGSPNASEAYGKCLDACRASYFPITGTVPVSYAPSATGVVASATSGDENAVATGAHGSGAGEEAATSATGTSGHAATSSPGAGTNVNPGAPLAGLAALAMAILAL